MKTHLKKCPKCGFNLEITSTEKLRDIIRKMTLSGKLADYVLNCVPKKKWHPEVIELAYRNLIINK